VINRTRETRCVQVTTRIRLPTSLLTGADLRRTGRAPEPFAVSGAILDRIGRRRQVHASRACVGCDQIVRATDGRASAIGLQRLRTAGFDTPAARRENRGDQNARSRLGHFASATPSRRAAPCRQAVRPSFGQCLHGRRRADTIGHALRRPTSRPLCRHALRERRKDGQRG
jgi:hypothetical protein